MIEEHRRVYRVSLAVVLVAAAVALPHDRTVACSLVLGIALYYVYLRVLTSTVTAQLDAAVAGSRPSALGYPLRMVALALPLLLAAMRPDLFNVLGAFAPLFLNHILTFVIYGVRGSAA